LVVALLAIIGNPAKFFVVWTGKKI
jgi:hypothetical protein